MVIKSQQENNFPEQPIFLSELAVDAAIRCLHCTKMQFVVGVFWLKWSPAVCAVTLKEFSSINILHLGWIGIFVSFFSSSQTLVSLSWSSCTQSKHKNFDRKKKSKHNISESCSIIFSKILLWEKKPDNLDFGKHLHFKQKW